MVPGGPSSSSELSACCQLSAPRCWNNSQPAGHCQPPASPSHQRRRKEPVRGWGRRKLSLDPPERRSFPLAHQETLKYRFCESVSSPVVQSVSTGPFHLRSSLPSAGHGLLSVTIRQLCWDRWQRAEPVPLPNDSGPARAPLQGRQGQCYYSL